MDWIRSIIHESPVVQGGLTLMVAGWVGYQLRALPDRAISMLRVRCTRVIEVREKNPLYDAWLGLLTEHAYRPGGPRTLEVRATSEDHDERAASSGFAAGSDSFWARLCGRWCRVSVRREDGVGATHDLVRRFIIRIEVFLGTTADLERMLNAAKARANVIADRQPVDMCNKYGASTTISLPKRDLSTLCLPRGFFEHLETRIREFAGSREDYERLGIPWRLGVLLYGEPGTGKTSIAHTLASQLDRRLAVIPLADMRSDEDLVSSFEGVRDDSFVLIEDIDCAFKQRGSEDANGITFSGFLNCIDGVIAPRNGRVLLMSTNHIDRLDPALIRPGRADIKLEVPLLTHEAATDYVDRLFAHVATRHDAVAEVMATERPTSAALINRLMRKRWRTTRDIPSIDVPKGTTVGRLLTARKRHRMGRTWR
ncbi:MAG: AAA family ATPase [Planctomycetota bacterium]